MLSISELREILDYDPVTGIFRWKTRVAQRCHVGDIAGRISGGYRHFSIRGGNYRACRVAFAFVHGRWPRGQIDHVNRQPADDRIANLRECSHSENMRNMLRKPRSGLKGAQYKRPGYWQSMIRINGHPTYLGSFKSPELAHEAYARAAREHYGEFARVGDDD
jgi:hypothetical protein